MNLYANMLDISSDAREAVAAQQTGIAAEASARPATLAALAARSRLVGVEPVDGRQAYHLRAEGLDHVQQADGQAFRLASLSLWVDAEHYVPLRMLVEGTAESAGETRALTIERVDQDYRTVPGSMLYEPYRQVMRLRGIMSEAQRAEMAEARAQIADAHRQLAALPAAQRRMVMGRMGPQMEQLEAMASGNGIEIVTEVLEIRVNQPLSAQSTGGVYAVANSGGRPTRTRASQDDERLMECLHERAAAARQSQERRRGIGRLFSAVDRVAARAGNFAVRRFAHDVMQADATATDLQAAARDLGLTADDVEICRQR